MQHPQEFDVIVVGGGHAGTEAAMAAARVGARTLLLTQSIETIGQMSCNPAIGGIGKGHIVREIDALDGVMARAIDRAGIHFKRLNARKGPAVRATRAQADRALYRQAIRTLIEDEANLSIFQQTVEDFVIEGESIRGVVTQMGLTFKAPTVVLTTGTFLGGLIHVGQANYAGGRAGDAPSNALAAKIRELPFRVERLKTGTPPRIDGRTIDYSTLEAQHGDDPAPVFSFLGSRDEHPRQVPCHITHTNERTHDIIRSGLDRSPMYTGVIEGVGPRYCPSVEDKIVRFADKQSHQIFIEPEGLDINEVYPNGISTSLPFDVQWDLVRSITGFENAVITRPGYAIEYDFLDPRDLSPGLETTYIDGLFFAGQINGTTGYEEAAGQGLVAGTNAALKVLQREPWWPRRDEAYIGVMIDDLITRGTNEPYRMFTSRAEYRLLLREDNADLRLTEKGRELGLVGDLRFAAFEKRRDAIEAETARLHNVWIRPQTPGVERLVAQGISRETRALDLLRRPEIDYAKLTQLETTGPAVEDESVAEQIQIQCRYAGYIDRQRDEVERHRLNEETVLSHSFNYDDVRGLSVEACQKLGDHKPATIGQASRIPGITPAAISLLLVHLKKRSAA